MDLIKPTRRGFLGLAMSALAAPVIVKAASIMPVKIFSLPREGTIRSVTFANGGYTEVFLSGVWCMQAQWMTWHQSSPSPIDFKDYFSTIRDARLSA